MDEWLKFKVDSFKDNREHLLGMKELRQRKKELIITEYEWDAVWMLTIIKKRKKIDKFIFQLLRDIVKQGGDDMIRKFEDKFKEFKVEGCHRDGGPSSLVLYTEDKEGIGEDPDYPDKAETKETMFM